MTRKKNRTTEIMNEHTEKLKDEGVVETSFNKEERVLTITMNLEIIKYHRPRHNRFTTYDPMDKYKRLLKKLIKESMAKNNIVVPEEYRDFPIEIEAFYYTVPVKSGNSLGVIALMINNLFKRTKNPDIDNFDKTSYDVLNDIVWSDDSQIFRSIANKMYAEEEKTIIHIKYVPNYGYLEGETTEYRKLLKQGIITDRDLQIARTIKNNKT